MGKVTALNTSPGKAHSKSARGACPVCGSSKLEALGSKGGYDFVSCANCLFSFCPGITADYLASLYAAGYHGPEEGAPEAGWAKTAAFLDPVLEMLKDRAPLLVLDFGTGQSRTPDALRDQGHRVTAVDVVPPIRPHADRLTGDLLGLQLPADHFDLVFSYQVFEHIPEPKPILDELLRVTSPGGLVLIHTDMETPERDEGFLNWWYVLPPDHCAFYRHRTFEVYLQETGHKMTWKDEKRVVLQKRQAMPKLG